jgi:hypothetical protein
MTPRLRLVLAGVAVALAGSAVAFAAVPPIVSLNLSPGYGRQTLAPGCDSGNRDNYALFHRGARIVVAGSVRPRPTARGGRVTILGQRCVAKRVEDGGTGHVAGRPDGSFRTVYLAGIVGAFRVRAYYGPKHVKSNSPRFVVR